MLRVTEEKTPDELSALGL